MSLLPMLLLFGLLGAMMYFMSRRQRRAAQQQQQLQNSLAVGDRVMTTSGLYGTVVGRNDDDSVLLSIAPGVEVRWALAALRDLESLPMDYRGEPNDAEADADEAP